MPAPVITTPTPAPGTPLKGTDAVTFQVTSGTGLLRVFVSIKYPGIGITEVVHDGTSFTGPYASLSSRTAISGGFQYTVLRAPVWPDAPQMSVYAEDTGGLETVAAFSWPLAAPVPLPSPIPTIPVFPVNGGASQVSIVLHDQAYYLAVYDRIMSSTWLFPLKTYPNSGYEILQAYAKIGARMSQAIANLEQGNVIMFAQGGSFAQATVEFLRPTSQNGPVTMRAGTTVTTSINGRDFVTQQDAVFGPFDVGPISVPAQAVAQSWQWNVKGRVITPRGETLPGEIDTIKRFIQVANPITVTDWKDASLETSPGYPNTGVPHWILVIHGGPFYTSGQLLWDNGSSTGNVTALTPGLSWAIFLDPSFVGPTPGSYPTALNPSTFLTWNGFVWALTSNPENVSTYLDPTITVQQVADASGGADPMLDGLGHDRGMDRLPGETDPAYRLRMRSLPDTISPDAVLRQVAQFITPYLDPGQVAQFIETFDIRYQTCWDAPLTTLENPAFDPNLFCYDDPRPAWDPNDPNRPPGSLPFFNRWLDTIEDRGAFIEVLPNFAAIADCGMAFDDTAIDTLDHEDLVGTVPGHRGYAAFDVPDNVDPTVVFAGGYDGFDLPKQAIYASLWALLRQVKAAGVASIIEQQGQ